ncbi:MAG: PQQ-binding-like beta-propeller repeat protein [Alphaproteobacteria bacterium]
MTHPLHTVRRARAGVLLFALALGLGPAVPGASADDATWSHVNGGASGERYLDAPTLRPRTADDLREVWRHETGHNGRTRQSDVDVAFDTTPVLAGDRLFLCTPYNEVQALDPGTGRLLWRFDPGVGNKAAPEDGFSCRGVTPWHTGAASGEAPADTLCAARIFTVTQDAALLALDQASGVPCPGFGRQGTVDLSDPTGTAPKALRAPPPPVVAGGRIIAAATVNGRPVLRAFETRTGAPVWTFDPAAGSSPDPADRLALAWTAPAADEAADLLFAPTPRRAVAHDPARSENPSSAANTLFALRASTGETVWRQPIVRNDLWAYDLPATPTLTTLMRSGRPVPAVVLPARTGHVFVFHRETGAPLFPIEDHTVPTLDPASAPQAATQPLPTLPPPLTPTHLRPDDAWGVTFVDRNACADRIGTLQSKGLFTPPSRQGTVLFPYTGGGANWGGAAIDRDRGRLFINTSSLAQTVTLMTPDAAEKARADDPTLEIEHVPGRPLVAVRQLLMSPMGLPCNAPPWGQLHAIDLKTGHILWQSVLGSTRDLAPLGFRFDWGTPNAGGPLVTAGGLVFIAATMDRYLRAFDAETGEEIWKGRLPAGGQASPMGYVWRGRPFVVIAAGGSSLMDTKTGDSVLAFSFRR